MFFRSSKTFLRKTEPRGFGATWHAEHVVFESRDFVSYHLTFAGKKVEGNISKLTENMLTNFIKLEILSIPYIISNFKF